MKELIEIKKQLIEAMIKVDELINQQRFDMIDEVVCKYFNISITELYSASRSHKVTTPRQVIIWYHLTKENKTSEQAADKFNLSPSMSAYSKKTINDLIETDSNFAALVNDIVNDKNLVELI